MHGPLLLCGLLASAVSFMLTHAAVTDKRQTDCSEHYGWIQLRISEGSDYYYLANVADGADFHVLSTSGDAGKRDAAIFRLTGCMGGSSTQIYCTTCDGSGNSFVGTRSSHYDASGQPDTWVLYNMGVDAANILSRDDNSTRRQYVNDGTVYSLSFTWDINDLIRPVTFDMQGLGNNQGILYYTWTDLSPQDTDQITFVKNTVDGSYDYLWFEEE